MVRGPAIGDIEKDIQERANKKDSKLKIIGLNKEYITTYKDFKVYLVDTEWIRNNLDVIFGSGGHGKVHTFIPNNEIWVSRERDSDYQARCIIHESNEFKEMSNLPYYQAHKSSQKEEFLHPEDEARLKKILDSKKSHGISNLKEN